MAVLGATGYAGVEAVRLLASHPFVELSVLTSEHYAGRRIADVYGHLAGLDLPVLEEMRPDTIGKRAEVAISCLPHVAGAATLAALTQAGLRVIDVAADFRLKDPEKYRHTYKADHPAPELLKQAVYGLCEFHRREIREARLIAVPGCYPTGALLGLLPLIEKDLVDPSWIVIDAKSGTTGSGRVAQTEQIFAEVNENARAYNVGVHRHTPEVEQEIAAVLGRDVAVMFSPTLIPVSRGILSSIYVRPRKETTLEDVRGAFESTYARSRFIRLLPPGRLPELKNVRATNSCEIACVFEKRSQTLCIITAIDNLGKGAAGQAIQNLNIMMGFDEAAGLLSTAAAP